MLLRQLVLENYGLFAGTHEFDVAPRVKYGQHRPIILFGGKNGAGKTTLLEAIRLALYGRISLGPRVRQVDYTAFLRGRIHRAHGRNGTPAAASVAIDFDHVHRGNCDRYFVKRSWHASGSDDVSEALTVRKNDKPLDEVEEEFWQGFVRDIIPEGLAQLFFFDGEKIRELAEDATGSDVLADSIKSLLGLDLVERLDTDLTVYSNREAAKLGCSEDRERIAKAEAEAVTLRQAIISSNEELASVRTRTDGVQAEIRRAEEDLRREGEDLARRRHALQEEAGELNQRIGTAERTLREQCEGVFPLVLCPKTAKLLKQQLAAERTLAHAGHVRSALNRTWEDLRKLVRSRQARKAGLTSQSSTAVQAVIDSVFAERVAEVSHHPGMKPLHLLSEVDYRRVNQWLGQARGKSRAEVLKRCTDLTRRQRRLDMVERRLAQAPSDEAVAPKLQALAELNRRLGGLERARSEIEDCLRRLAIDLEQKERELKRLTERYQGSAEAGSRVALARTVQGALDEYLRQLTKLKVGQLQRTVAACFNRLCRKGDVVRSIDIDPKTFAVTLCDRSGHAVPKEELSSGEKQIFAIAMLWGLASTSGRPLPVIIDTPLGRLDSDHRRKLIHEYFPHASHQVVLLSTDTEVDQALFTELSPSISHSYQLNYLPDEARSEISEGYFWRKREEKLCPT